jgi:hypothetical protein
VIRRRRLSDVRDGLRKDAVTRETEPEAPRPEVPAALPRPDLVQLEAEARYHRDRLRIYRGRVVSSKPSSPGRLRELERTSVAADERLRHARRS